jgi:hypothetical protein
MTENPGIKKIILSKIMDKKTIPQGNYKITIVHAVR